MSTVYRAREQHQEQLKKLKSATTILPMKWASGKPVTIADQKSKSPALSLSIQLLSLDGTAEIKVRNGEGVLLGTIVLETEGICYRRPNQKSGANRKLTWAILNKLIQVGLV